MDEFSHLIFAPSLVYVWSEFLGYNHSFHVLNRRIVGYAVLVGDLTLANFTCKGDNFKHRVMVKIMMMS